MVVRVVQHCKYIKRYKTLYVLTIIVNSKFMLYTIPQQQKRSNPNFIIANKKKFT